MSRYLMSAGRVIGLATLSAALALTACKEVIDEHGAEVDFLRITLAGQAPVIVNATGAVSGTLSLTQHIATTLTIEFLDATQQDALGDAADEFQANVAPGAGITFTRSGPFTGTLTASATGDITVSVAMFHIEDGEEEFGPFPVTITVSPPPTQRD